MSHSPVKCPKCGGTEFTDNGGAGKHFNHNGGHAMGHTLSHGQVSLFALGMAAASFAMRAAFPLRLTCKRCGHTFKD